MKNNEFVPGVAFTVEGEAGILKFEKLKTGSLVITKDGVWYARVDGIEEIAFRCSSYLFKQKVCTFVFFEDCKIIEPTTEL